MIDPPFVLAVRVRNVFVAKDGVDYVPGERGYRALTSQFVAEKAEYCGANNLAYLAVHCHGGINEVGFSSTDLESHSRGYPALLDITKGGPVGALVFATGAVAGDIWQTHERFEVSHLKIVGSTVRHLYPTPIPTTSYVGQLYDRHVRLFGDVGQRRLGDLKVGIIGLGGGGSLLNEWFSRLGIGRIVAVDPQRIDVTNLPRVVGASKWDALFWLAESKSQFLRAIAHRFARHKVTIARRVARQANPGIKFDAIAGDVLEAKVARRLTDVDFLFLATDNFASRLVFNAIAHQYLIPGFQVGVKVTKMCASGEIDEIHIASRPVLPERGGGCLKCQGAIPPGRVQEEALTGEERRRQRYIDSDEVEQPSVITLNVLSAAQAANDLLFAVTGLLNEGVRLKQQIIYPRERKGLGVIARAAPDCRDCGTGNDSRKAKGDRARLPCREQRRSNG